MRLEACSCTRSLSLEEYCRSRLLVSNCAAVSIRDSGSTAGDDAPPVCFRKASSKSHTHNAMQSICSSLKAPLLSRMSFQATWPGPNAMSGSGTVLQRLRSRSSLRHCIASHTNGSKSSRSEIACTGLLSSLRKKMATACWCLAAVSA